MKRLRRVVAAEATTKQDQLSEMISQLDDDFEYALSGLEKLSRSGNADIESGIAIATELSGNIQDIIAQISDLFTEQYPVEESVKIKAASDSDRKLFTEYKIWVDGRLYEISHTERRKDEIVPILKSMYPDSVIEAKPYRHYESGYARKQLERLIARDAEVDSASDITADTIKKKNGKWVNRGDTGKEHGEFDTKKEADAQRKAMYATRYKG